MLLKFIKGKETIMKKLKILTTTLAITLCTMLFILPANAALIGGDGGFYYSLKSNKTATLEEYHGSSADIAIPSEVYSYTVTEIAENTFSNNSTIKSVTIPNSIATIGSYSFYGCSNLERAELPSSVTNIKAATFYGCASLTEITIPASVTQIAANAFIGCDNLTIKSEGDSYAESYAAEHGIKFIDVNAPEPQKVYSIVGDADCDGKITSVDALYVLRMSVNLEDYTAEDIPYFDVDDDKMISSADSLEILRYSVLLSNNEKIGNPLA